MMLHDAFQAAMFRLLSFVMIPLPLKSTLFPYTTLFRSVLRLDLLQVGLPEGQAREVHTPQLTPRQPQQVEDRKSTRLNSSHANISYAVFCLKKKKRTCLSEIERRTVSVSASSRMRLSRT